MARKLIRGLYAAVALLSIALCMILLGPVQHALAAACPTDSTLAQGAAGDCCPQSQIDANTANPGNCCPSGQQADATGACQAASDATLDCAGGVLNWVVCPAIQIFQGAAQGIDHIIMSQLSVNTQNIFETSCDSTTSSNCNTANAQAYYTAWNSFRIIGTAIIVIAGLVMIVAQATGFEAIDAYTIRKVLPRLGVAIIGIQLSWPLLQIVINFFNVVGYDVREIMYAPFVNLASSNNTGAGILTVDALTTGALLTSIFAVIAAGGELFALFGVPLILLLVSVLVAALTALATLILRQIAIIILVIMSPVAIACYILPGTQKVWKLWYENFLALMMMFPIVSMMIAAGHILAAVSRTGGTFAQFMSIIAYFVPYFFLPKAFQWAGGAFAGLAAGVLNSTKGMQGGLRGLASSSRQKRHERAMAGDLAKGRFGDMYRRGVIGATVPHSGAFGITQAARDQYRATHESHLLAEKDALLKRPGVNNAMMDDNVRGVLAVGEERAQAFMAAKGITAPDQQRAVMSAARSVGFTEAARVAALEGESTHGKGRNMDAYQAVYGRSDNSQAMESLVNSVGRSAGMNSEGVERLMQGTMYNFRSNGRADLGQPTVGDAMTKKFDTQQAATASDSAMHAMTSDMTSRLRTAASVNEKADAAAQLLAVDESKSRMAEPTRRAAVSGLAAAGVDYSSREPVETQLAKQILGPGVAAAYDTAQSNLRTSQAELQRRQQAVDDEVKTSGTASAASMSALQAARAQVDADRSYIPQDVDRLAQHIRATSSTYGSSTPNAVRNEP